MHARQLVVPVSGTATTDRSDTRVCVKRRRRLHRGRRPLLARPRQPRLRPSSTARGHGGRRRTTTCALLPGLRSRPARDRVHLHAVPARTGAPHGKRGTRGRTPKPTYVRPVPRAPVDDATPYPPAVWERIRARARRGDRSIDQPATADFSFRIASSSFSFLPPPAPALLPRPRHGSPSRTTRNVTATSSLLYVALAIGRPPVRAGGFERTRRRRK